MKEQLETLTIQAMQDLLSNLSQAKHFVLEQAPDVLQQMVLQARVEYSLYLVLPSILILAHFLISKNILSKSDDKETTMMGVAMTGAIIDTCSIIFLFASIHDFVSCWFAPKVYLLEHIMSIVK